MGLSLKHQTPAELLARFRAAYRRAAGEKKARMDAWALDRLADKDVTDAQMRNAFGQTVAEFNQMKARMTNLRAQHETVKSAKGE